MWASGWRPFDKWSVTATVTIVRRQYCSALIRRAIVFTGTQFLPAFPPVSFPKALHSLVDSVSLFGLLLHQQILSAHFHSAASFGVSATNFDFKLLKTKKNGRFFSFSFFLGHSLFLFFSEGTAAS